MKKFTLWLVIAMLLVSASAVFADHHEYSYTEKWDGRGSDSERCGYYDENRDPVEGWIHWVFSTKGASTDAQLFLMDLDGNLLGNSPYMPAEPLNASVWHFFTPYFELAELQAKIELFGGLPGKGGGLVISDYCPGGEEVMLDVEKTANTSFTRTHDWDIAKKVETQKQHMLDGFPKIWLYTDGMGNEKATWTIDVTYLGYKDTEHKVWGDITIENIGKVDAKIVDIMDWLIPFDPMGTPIPAKVTCGGEELSTVLPYDLAVGMKLECKYSHMFDPDEAFEGYNYVEVITDEDKKFYDDADIIWGDPDPELLKTVNIKDISDLFGEVELGEVTAPNNAKFTYEKDFNWADYGKDKCGHFDYDNTASIVETGQSASATLLVNVQCMIFKGETAWAANGHTAGSLRYTKQGNWATYVKYEGVKKGTTLFAGQTIPVGKVYFSAPTSTGKVKITVKMTTPWEYEQVKENLKVQDYSKAPTGNPSPGLFKWKKTCDPVQLACWIVVPKNNFYGVHANVGWWMPDPNFGPK
jgi:hypothetical protein